MVIFSLFKVARIQSIAYYWTTPQIHFRSAQKGKDVRKFQKSHKNLSETVPFALTLQPCSPEFLTLGNTDFKKNVSFVEYSEIAGRLPEKGL